jgi:kynurenine formamidase
MSSWLDCTQPICEGMPKMHFLPEPRFEVLKERTDHGPQISQIHICTHLGTHVDAASHFIAGGKHIHEYPAQRFLLNGVVWQVPAQPNAPITVEDLKGLEVREGEAVFFATGWGERLEDPSYFAHPYLAEETCRWLVERGVSLIGLDFLTPDMPPSMRGPGFNSPAHRTLLGNDVLIIENLTNLAQVGSSRVEIIAPPIYVKAQVEAAPARVLIRQR